MLITFEIFFRYKRVNIIAILAPFPNTSPLNSILKNSKIPIDPRSKKAPLLTKKAVIKYKPQHRQEKLAQKYFKVLIID